MVSQKHDWRDKEVRAIRDGKIKLSWKRRESESHLFDEIYADDCDYRIAIFRDVLRGSEDWIVYGRNKVTWGAYSFVEKDISKTEDEIKQWAELHLETIKLAADAPVYPDGRKAFDFAHYGEKEIEKAVEKKEMVGGLLAFGFAVNKKRKGWDIEPVKSVK
jgi:hypothetical protein